METDRNKASKVKEKFLESKEERHKYYIDNKQQVMTGSAQLVHWLINLTRNRMFRMTKRGVSVLGIKQFSDK